MLNIFNPLRFYRRLYRYDNLESIDLNQANKNSSENKIASEIEEYMKRYIGFKYAIFVPSCRAGLDFIIKSINIKKTENIVSQAFGCSKVMGIIKSNCNLKFCDIEENTFNLDYKNLEKTIDKNTRAVMAINLYGNPANLEAIKKVCKKKKVLFIEDCAHSLGAKFKGKIAGSFGDISIFSFGKRFFARGGLVMTNNKELFEKVLLTKQKYEIQGKHSLSAFFGKIALFNLIYLKNLNKIFPIWLPFVKLFESSFFRLGNRSIFLKPNSFESSLCLSQLLRNDSMIKKSNKDYKSLYDALANTPGIQLFSFKDGSTTLRFPIRFKKQINPVSLSNYLYRQGCFEPSLNYCNEYISNIKSLKEKLPISDKIARSTIVVTQDNFSKKDMLELKYLIEKFIKNN